MASAASNDAVAAGATPAAELRLTDEMKEQFKQQLHLTAIRIPKQSTSHYMKLLSKHLFNKPRMQNVIKDEADPEMRLLLLEEHLGEEDLAARQVDPDTQRSVADVLQADGLALVSATVDVDYAYWPAHAVLQRLLPEGLEVPSAFESVGHIAHLNLKGELLPYKYLIAQVIVDKNPRLQTVVNKVSSIENEYRVFPMELLAGKGSMETVVRQHGANFKLDFSQVYWNSRLEREHQRVVERFQPGETVLDAMAGIGPFAIPAAQKGCLVYANDLNPSSYKFLCENIGINRVGGRVLPFNLDGRQCMRLAAAGQLDVAAAAQVVPPPAPKKSKPGQQQQKQQQQQQQGVQGSTQQQEQQPAAAQPGQSGNGGAAAGSSGRFQHIVMNLPASAVEFLDALKGSFSRQLWEGHPLPLVHVHAFAKGEDELANLRQRVEASLGGPLEEEPEVHLVRDVAPKKIMVCVTFRVPPSIAFADQGAAGTAGTAGTAADEPAKRQRTE